MSRLRSLATGGDRRATNPGIWAITVLTAALYTTMALLRHRQFGTAGYDLGIFDQAVRRYAHFQAPMVPLKGAGYNIFGDHFHPIIALGAPFYWIWENPQTLLILQAVLIAASIPVVHRFTRRRTGAGTAAAICLGYALSWPFQTMVNFDFHEVAWGVPILALAIDALDRRADRGLLLWCALLVLVREDMGILVLLLGLLRLVQGRPEPASGGSGRRHRLADRWPGLVLVVGGVAMYELTTAVVLPHFSPTGSFAYWQYGPTLGPNLGAAVRNAITDPAHVVRLFFSPEMKFRTLCYLVVPLLLLPFRSRYALLALPLLAQRFFEPPDRKLLWEPHYHYNALPWVVLVLAAVDGGARLGLFEHRRLRAAFVVWTLLMPIYFIVHVPNVAQLQNLFNGQMFRLDAQMKAQQAAVDQVPHDVCVAADDRIAGHLTGHDWVTIPGLVPYSAVDLVVLDLSQDSVGGNLGPTPQSQLAAVTRAGFTLRSSIGTSLQIWQSPTYHGPSSECGPLGSGH